MLLISSGSSVLTLKSQTNSGTSGVPVAAAPGLFYNGVNEAQNSGIASYGTVSGTANNGRVVNTSEALVGELDHGSFEHVTGEIISNLTSMNGYVASSNLMYNGTTWLGIYEVSVPTGNATQFLFQVKDLVDANGKTTSVQISTVDVTSQTGGNQSKVPFSSFGLTLQEMAPRSKSGSNVQITGVLSSISVVLFTVLDGAAYVVLIGVPLYLLILAGVLVSSRILYPMFLKVSKNASTKQKDAQL